MLEAGNRTTNSYGGPVATHCDRGPKGPKGLKNVLGGSFLGPLWASGPHFGFFFSFKHETTLWETDRGQRTGLRCECHLRGGSKKSLQRPDQKQTTTPQQLASIGWSVPLDPPHERQCQPILMSARDEQQHQHRRHNVHHGLYGGIHGSHTPVGVCRWGRWVVRVDSSRGLCTRAAALLFQLCAGDHKGRAKKPTGKPAR